MTTTKMDVMGSGGSGGKGHSRESSPKAGIRLARTALDRVLRPTRMIGRTVRDATGWGVGKKKFYGGHPNHDNHSESNRCQNKLAKTPVRPVNATTIRSRLDIGELLYMQAIHQIRGGGMCLGQDSVASDGLTVI